MSPDEVAMPLQPCRGYLVYDGDSPHFQGDTDGSVEFYRRRKTEFHDFVEAWIFDPNTSQGVVKGFFRAKKNHSPRAESPPTLREPHMILIDRKGAQMWLTGVGSSGGHGSGGATRILEDAGFEVDPSVGLDSSHYVNRRPVPNPFRGVNPALTAYRRGRMTVSPDGERAVDLVSLPFRNPAKFQEFWRNATGPGTWLGTLDELTLYSSEAVSRNSLHYGYGLIASGTMRREIWVELPGPYFEELQSRHREYEWVDDTIEYVFGTAGVDPELRDTRGWLAGQNDRSESTSQPNQLEQRIRVL